MWTSPAGWPSSACSWRTSTRPAPRGADLLRARPVVLTRAGLLLVLGGLTQLLVVDVATTLEQYAVLLALCVPLLRWRPRRLLVLAAVLVVVVDPVVHLVLEP